jgi:hypothetical protein
MLRSGPLRMSFDCVIRRGLASILTFLTRTALLTLLALLYRIWDDPRGSSHLLLALDA